MGNCQHIGVFWSFGVGAGAFKWTNCSQPAALIVLDVSSSSERVAIPVEMIMGFQ